MRIIQTKDESPTFYNEDAKQCYHSVSGAIEEALEKHVRPSGIFELRKKDKIRILDICFGMGYNSAVALDVILEENPTCEIEIIGIDYDEQVMKDATKLNPEIKNFYMIKKAINKENLPENIKIELIVDDLKRGLEKVNGFFDVVFFDPFSPKFNMDLWHQDIFEKVYSLMKKGAKLTTYSCASKVRVNMARAGFKVKDGPRVGRRGPSTICIK